MKIGDQDKSWAPHVICGTCRSNLDGWLRGDRHSMPFAIPKIWREPQNHIDDCYICMVDISRFRKTKNRHDIAYPSIPSSIAPVPHSSELPLPKPPSNKAPKNSAVSQDMEEDSDEEFNISHPGRNSEPHFSSQQELDDSVRNMGLTKSNAELLTSRLKRVELLRGNNYKLLVNNLMEEYKTIGCRMSLKMHFLHSHLDFLVQIWVT